MNSTEIFTVALGLSEPWYVSKVEFIDGERSRKELHIWLNCRRGHRFRIGDKESTAYDTIDKTWRHLNFFEYLCYLHTGVPRIKTGEHETVMADVPWARKNTGFTLLFEACSMLLIEREMPVNGVSCTVHETAPRIWRIFNHWVSKAVKKIDVAGNKASGENEEFGNERGTSENFTDYSASKNGGTLSPETHALVQLMNPMPQIGHPDVTVAQHWYIRHGAIDRDTSFPVPLNLAMKLKNSGKDVNYLLAWNRPHSGDYSLDELFSWIRSITQK